MMVYIRIRKHESVKLFIWTRKQQYHKLENWPVPKDNILI